MIVGHESDTLPWLKRQNRQAGVWRGQVQQRLWPWLLLHRIRGTCKGMGRRNGPRRLGERLFHERWVRIDRIIDEGIGPDDERLR